MNSKFPTNLKNSVTDKLFAQQNRKQVMAYSYLSLTLFTVAIFGVFVIAPAFSTISNLQKKLEDSTNVFNALETKLSALRKLDLQYEQIKGDLDLVYGAIPTSAQIPILTRQVETLCKQNNVTLNSFDVETIDFYPIASNQQLYSYSFSLSAEGSDTDLNTLISKLVSFNRLISITNITTGKTPTGIFGLTLSGKAFFAQ
ncbi:MAG: type 4a pilus biogenesis protein PilO [Candidatus Levyibacteriota bacterium]